MTKYFQKIVGYILMVPSLLTVFFYVLFFVGQIFWEQNAVAKQTITSIWLTDLLLVGEMGRDVHDSTIPIFFGLMAIAGAYLIVDKNSNL